MPRRSSIPDKIISALWEEPTVTREDLSKRLGVSYQAVQKHLLSLQKEGVIAPSFSVLKTDFKKYQFWVLILTKHHPPSTTAMYKEGLDDDYQKKLCSDIAASFGTKSELMEGLVFGGTHILIGGTHDIILRLFTDDPNAIEGYVTRFLRAHPAVASTSTAWSMTQDVVHEVKPKSKQSKQ